ncbi:MAG: GNAT family N-acetyltransferase [Olsenella sp.]|jgi:RimJ/RimL family protein N-acetyltransferase|nr:GNAT family N-acetyltransferase [Olsenella sp.]
MSVIEYLPLETERLLLRRYTLADAPAIYRINSSEEVTRYLPFGPMMSEEDAKGQLERFFLPAYERADSGQRGPGGLPLDLKFAACLKDTKELVGMVFVETSDGSCELGYTVDPRWWGRGIATEMCQAVVDLARRLGLTRLTATVDVRNTASERVLAHIGMKPRRPAEGIWQGGEKNGCRLWELELAPSGGTASAP